MGEGVLIALQWCLAERKKGSFYHEECKMCENRDKCSPEKKEYRVLYSKTMRGVVGTDICRERRVFDEN